MSSLCPKKWGNVQKEGLWGHSLVPLQPSWNSSKGSPRLTLLPSSVSGSESKVDRNGNYGYTGPRQESRHLNPLYPEGSIQDTESFRL